MDYDSKTIIENGIGTIGKIKIIKALADENKMVTIYVLHKRTGLKREDIKRNLKDLRSIDWIKEKKMANRMYLLNKDNEYVNAILDFFADVGYIGQD
jgi:DNA-binding IclR family transcriptional regulator